MFGKLTSQTSFALLLCLLLSTLVSLTLLTSCDSDNEPDKKSKSTSESTTSRVGTQDIVLVTDSDEWYVQIFKDHLVYSEAAAITLPAPWSIPTREDAQFLRTLTFPNSERFITSDGYTFGMPSANVSKAGAKTKYSVLGFYRRRTVIVVEIQH